MVDWVCEGDEADTRLALDWYERGGPPVDKPSRSGFGTKLLQTALGQRPRQVEP